MFRGFLSERKKLLIKKADELAANAVHEKNKIPPVSKEVTRLRKEIAKLKAQNKKLTDALIKLVTQ